MASSTELLSFEDSGKGPVIVLLHGFLESHSMWDILRLNTHFRTIAIDLPGHGNSGAFSELTSISEIALAVKATLNSLGVKQFHLLGHSMGGYVLLAFLNLFGCEGKIVLLNSNFWCDDEKKQSDRLRVADLALKNKNLFIQQAIPGLFTNPSQHKLAIESLVIEAKQIPAEHIASNSIAMRNRDDHKKTIWKWAKKVTVLQGATDKICSQERMERELVGLEIAYLCVPNAGHMSHIENNSFVRNAILKIFLDKD